MASPRVGAPSRALEREGKREEGRKRAYAHQDAVLHAGRPYTRAELPLPLLPESEARSLEINYSLSCITMEEPDAGTLHCYRGTRGWRARRMQHSNGPRFVHPGFVHRSPRHLSATLRMARSRRARRGCRQAGAPWPTAGLQWAIPASQNRFPTSESLVPVKTGRRTPHSVLVLVVGCCWLLFVATKDTISCPQLLGPATDSALSSSSVDRAPTSRACRRTAGVARPACVLAPARLSLSIALSL